MQYKQKRKALAVAFLQQHPASEEYRLEKFMRLTEGIDMDDISRERKREEIVLRAAGFARHARFPFDIRKEYYQNYSLARQRHQEQQWYRDQMLSRQFRLHA